MKSAQLTKYGEKKVVQIRDLPTPTPSDEQVLVKIYAAGVNPFDYKLMLGSVKDSITLNLPVTLGSDFAGQVVETGERVYGSANILSTGSGSFAEMALVPEKTLSQMPKSLNYVEAAALPLPGVSAVIALIEHIELKKNQKILIHGGAGGIGTIAIQIAKHLGAMVAVTVSEHDEAYVKKLGADFIIDYRQEKFETLLTNYDAVFDTVGHDVTNRSLSIIKDGGVLVSMIQEADQNLSAKSKIKTIYQHTRITTERLQKLADLVDQGAVKVHVEKTFPLDKAEEALNYLRQTPPQGKIVLKVA